MSVIVTIVVLVLDNVECFQQTNIYMFHGSWIFILAIICATAMISLPMYAAKCWEMAISAP